MICGLTTNFTQPIGYFLSSWPMNSCDLSQCILRAIKRVHNTGLHTIVFVMDKIQAVKEMNVMDDITSVDGKNTYVFVNAHHLVKNTKQYET